MKEASARGRAWPDVARMPSVCRAEMQRPLEIDAG